MSDDDLQRLVPAAIIGALILIALVFMLLGWRNRRRKQERLDVVPVPPTEVGTVTHEEKLLYVATTLADQPLERVVVGGLGFRAKAILSITDGGVVLSLAGNAPAFIPVADIRGVGLASWAIDKGVGGDGLVFIRWDLGGTEVDSYLRPENPDALLDALTELSPGAIARVEADPDATPRGDASA